MPLYDYRCPCGETRELNYPMDRSPRTVKCSCGKRAVKVCNAGGFQVPYGRAGGIQDDHPPWVRDSADVLQDPGWIKYKQEAPIESRSDLNRYCKHKGIALADECGTAKKPADTPIDPERRRKAIENIAKARQADRAITVGKLGTPAPSNP